MNIFKYIFAFGAVACALLAVATPEDAKAWIRGGVYISGPVYYPAYYPPAPTYYAYPPPYAAYAYPPAPPLPVQAPPPPAYPVANSGPPPLQDNCRDYTHTVVVAGQPQMVHGHACRQADGTWQIIN